MSRTETEHGHRLRDSAHHVVTVIFEEPKISHPKIDNLDLRGVEHTPVHKNEPLYRHIP